MGDTTSQHNTTELERFEYVCCGGESELADVSLSDELQY